MLNYMSYYFIFIFMFFTGVIVFCLNRKHLLIILLSLEYMVLGLFMALVFYLSYMGELYFSMIFLTLSVCEGALGLSILVSMVRTHGNDYFQSFNLI